MARERVPVDQLSGFVIVPMGPPVIVTAFPRTVRVRGCAVTIGGETLAWGSVVVVGSGLAVAGGCVELLLVVCGGRMVGSTRGRKSTGGMWGWWCFRCGQRTPGVVFLLK